MSPRYMIGDLVLKEPISRGASGWTGRSGMIVGVRRSNHDDRLPADVYPFVYYVFFHDGKFEGPLFHSELHGA